MRRVVIGGLVAAVLLALSTACARAIKSVVVTPAGGTTKVAVNTMSLVFHDPFTPGGCTLLEKPARFTAHYGESWSGISRIPATTGSTSASWGSSGTTTPSPIRLKTSTIRMDRRSSAAVTASKRTAWGRFRTRVRAGVKPGGYEYTILRRKRDRDWKIVDPMIDIVP